MSVLLTYAYLFFIGSIAGWCIEVVFRKFCKSSNPEHRWINPGFCTGPYLPLYGFGLCTLYTISTFADRYSLPLWAVIVLIVVLMTLIEYLAGIICLKLFKLRLWDYSALWGNIQGLICPLFSFLWGVLGTFYYFIIQPRIVDALIWLSENLAFSFFIGFFFGVFTLDVVHSANLVARIKKVANENKFNIHMEQLKSSIHRLNVENQIKTYFLRFFKTDLDISEIVESLFKDHKHPQQ